MRKKLLIIEDDNAIRNGVHDLMELEGFEVFATESGYEGIELARKHIPNVIICDIRMPIMDGYDVLKAIRQNHDTASIPFIFLTARATHEDLRIGMNYGADDYLTKPFEIQELLNAINTCLAKQKHVEQNLEHLRTVISRALPDNIQEPLTAIIKKTKAINEQLPEMPPEQIHELAQDIYTIGLSLEHLVENYLLYTNVEVLRNSPERLKQLTAYQLDISDALIQGYAQYRASLYNRNEDIQTKVEASSISIREDYFQKILEELIDHACRLSAVGSPIYIGGQPANEHYLLKVRCFGDQPPRLLMADIQNDSEMSDQETGTDFGLKLCNRSLKLLGGYLSIVLPGENETCFNAYFKM